MRVLIGHSSLREESILILDPIHLEEECEHAIGIGLVEHI